jgi:hypothetical protein
MLDVEVRKLGWLGVFAEEVFTQNNSRCHG